MKVLRRAQMVMIPRLCSNHEHDVRFTLRISRDYYRVSTNNEVISLLLAFGHSNPNQTIEVRLGKFRYYGKANKYIDEYYE